MASIHALTAIVERLIEKSRKNVKPPKDLGKRKKVPVRRKVPNRQSKPS